MEERGDGGEGRTNYVKFAKLNSEIFFVVLGNVNESRNFVEKTLLDGVTILHFEHL